MMQRIIKGRVGAFVASAAVLALTLGFVFYCMKQGHINRRNLTPYKASFISANGLLAGADVSLNGVSVGRVYAITLNPVLGKAVVSFGVDRHLRLPSDTAVTISSSTMTGNNALTLLVGQKHDTLRPNSTIDDARPLLSLEQQISNYIFGAGNL